MNSLPRIYVRGGGLADEATQAEQALIDAGIPIYQRGGSLVRPVIEEADASKGRRTKVAKLVEVTAEHLIDKLCTTAVWFKKNGDTDRKVNPTHAVANILLNREGNWKFPVVAGVISAPTLRPDGTILETSGYDPVTRLILVEPPPMPPIPELPTKEDAVQALKLLNELLSEFPFVDNASRSAALSALITPVVRGAFSVAPMHAGRASTPGSGKSFLIDTAAAIATGQICPVMSAGQKEEETEKRLGAALLASQPLISIDNVNSELGGDALCQAIERPIVDIRVLGESRRVRIESRATLFATGNHIILHGDMTRRVLIFTLDPGLERPELRQFNHNPVDEVLSDRGKYIAAALIVVRAYIVAGSPSLAKALASFEEWSNTVRSALIWLGMTDPVQTMETARREDPVLQNMRAVLHSLRECLGYEVKCTAAEIAKIAWEKDSAGDYKYPELRDAVIQALNSKDGLISANLLGKWLRRHKERIVDGMRLEQQVDEHGHAAQWWLTNCAAHAANSGLNDGASEEKVDVPF